MSTRDRRTNREQDGRMDVSTPARVKMHCMVSTDVRRGKHIWGSFDQHTFYMLMLRVHIYHMFILKVLILLMFTLKVNMFMFTLRVLIFLMFTLKSIFVCVHWRY